MTEFKSYIYNKPVTKRTFQEKVAICSFCLFVILLGITMFSGDIIILFISVAFLCICIIFGIISKTKTNDFFQERIIISESGIKIGDLVYNIDSISQLEIKISGYKGEDIGGDYSLNGLLNYISFCSENVSCSYEFYIGCKEQIRELKDLLLGWYRRNITFSEKYKDRISYDLDFLNYKEIQEFKAMYNLKI